MRLPRTHARRFRPASHAAVAAAFALLLACLVPTPGLAAPQASAKDLYLAAQAREKTIRAALDASPPEPPPTRDAMRQAAAAYRQVVLRHPTSGYSDNALWLAAQLLADTFARHGDERDRKDALQLLVSLTSEYPSSSLVPRARAEGARIMALGGAPPVAPSGATPPERPADAPPSAKPPDTASAPETVLVKNIRRRGTPAGAVVEVDLDGPVQFREERLYNPPRFFYDLQKTRTTDALKEATLQFESGPVRQVRIGRHPNDVTRVVMDMAADVRCVARLAGAPDRLVVTCGQDAAASTSAEPAPAPAGGRAAPGATGVTSAAAPSAVPKPAGGATTPGIASAPPAADSAPSADPAARPASLPKPAADSSGPAPAAPSANARGGYSMARQLGLRVGRIVIDPGHGGRDPGAQGPGYTEAALTLDIALRLERLLAKEPGVEVVLTRRTDEYVGLQERTAIANREGADLFLSIHANASRNRSARGVESYLLNFASTPEAAAVAARENASSTLTMSHLNDLVKQIALNSKLDESRDLARHVQTSMVRRLRASNQQVKDLGVKQAPFVVLVGASMPSVLVEVSFLTNKQEGRLMGTGAYRQRIAEALLDGVRRYLRTLKRAVTDAADDTAAAGAVRPPALQ
jgi:N-acetylmuramoyl-L-alanine amidase